MSYVEFINDYHMPPSQEVAIDKNDRGFIFIHRFKGGRTINDWGGLSDDELEIFIRGAYLGLEIALDRDRNLETQDDYDWHNDQ